MLGFMIISNYLYPVVRASGLKEMMFVMLLTEDSIQDERAVLCGKHAVFSKYLPMHANKTQRHSDGSTCVLVSLTAPTSHCGSIGLA